MNFRKLLAFVLVFSLAAQPGGVRFSYAEDTKAAEVKIEEKKETSGELAIDETELDEYLFDPGSRKQKLEEAATVAAEKTEKTSKINGALAGAITAGVAAVTLVVGAVGRMIYNGASNKDEIAKLWTSEEGSFFSRLGKTISILFKGGNNCRYGENEAGDKCLSDIELTACKYGEDEENRCCLAKKPANEIASLKDYQQKEAERLADMTWTQADLEKRAQINKKRLESLTYIKNKQKKHGLDCLLYITELDGENWSSIETKSGLQRFEQLIDEIKEKVDRAIKAKQDLPSVEKNLSVLKGVLSPAEFKGFYNEFIRLNVTEVDALLENSDAIKSLEDRVKKLVEANGHLSDSIPQLNRIIKNIKSYKCSAIDNEYLDYISKQFENIPLTENNIFEKYKEITNYLSQLRTHFKTSDIKAVIKVLKKIDNSELVKYFESEERSASDNEDRYEPYEKLVKALIAKRNEILAEANENHSLNGVVDKLNGLLSTEQEVLNTEAAAREAKGIIAQNKGAKWFNESYYEEWFESATKDEIATEADLVQRANNVAAILNDLKTNYVKHVKAVNNYLSKIDNSELVKYFESEERSASDNEDRYEPYEKLVKALIAKRNEILAEANENHSLNGVVGDLEWLLSHEKSIARKVLSIEGNTKEVKAVVKQYENEAWFDKARFEEWLNGATKDKIATEADLDLRANNVAAILNDLETNFSKNKKEIKAVNQKIDSLNNSDLLKGELGDDYADLRRSVESSMGQVIAEAKKNHSLNGVVEKLEELQANERSVVQKIRSLNRNTKASNDAIKQYENEAWFNKAYFEERLQGATKDKIATEADLDLRANNVAAILNDLETNFSKNKKEINAVNQKIDSLKNSDLLKGELGDDYADLHSSVESSMGQVIAEAKKNHSLNGVVEKLEELQANERSVVQKIRSLNKNIKAANDAIKQYEGEAWFDKAHFEEWMQGATKDKIATEADLDLRANNVAAILNDLETNYVKHAKAVNKALDKFDNSAIVKGTCTQSRWGGLKKENKLTPEQCNTLKDKFVAERYRLVKNANSNHSLVGLAEKLKNLYDNTDEYIDVAKLNADASELEEIIAKAKELDLIDADYVNKFNNNKEYSLDDLKTKREAMTELLNSLSTYTSDNIKDIKAVLALINDTLSDKNFTSLKGLSKNFKSEVNADIANIKSRAKADCSLDGVINSLNNLSDLCKDTVSKSGELIEKVSYANKIMKMQESFNVKIEPAVEGRYGIIKIAPTNTKELNGKILEMDDLLKDLNEKQWGKILEEDKKIRKFANGNQYKLRQYKKTLEDLQRKFSSKEISLKDVINRLKTFVFN